jgi:signal peptidase II
VISGPVSARRWVPAAAAAAAVIAADQLTKHWAVTALSDGSIIDVVWTLRFRLAFNTGMSFSMGSGLGPVISLIAVIVVVALFWATRQIRNPLGLVGIGLVLGGAVGNLIDRAFRAGDGFFGGAVVDFIDVQWWPVFNIADMGIVIGAAVVVLATWSDDAREPAPDDGGQP